MQIEDSGRQGDRVLVEGIKTGSAKILVRMEANPYAGSVKPVEIPLMVVANLYLVPSSALVLPGGKVGYHAEQIKSNKVNSYRVFSCTCCEVFTHLDFHRYIVLVFRRHNTTSLSIAKKLLKLT
jgi:hypothetical protein